jgi:hypothetical protein
MWIWIRFLNFGYPFHTPSSGASNISWVHTETIKRRRPNFLQTKKINGLTNVA